MSNDIKMEVFATPNGKEITTFYEGRNLRVKFIQGGELPECLSGLYTNPTHAKNAILTYISQLSYPKGKIVNDKSAPITPQED